MQRTLFSELQVSSEIKSAVEGIGLEKCSSLQAECIPLIMEGKDVLAKCISNAGVVDAYAIPTVDSVDTNVSEIQSLVLVNDRQRALVVAEEMRLYAEKKVGVSIGSIYTGQPGSVQDRVIKSKPHILVAQLKSLESLIEDEKVVFDELKLIVADELSDLANSALDEAIETLLESTTEDTQFVAFTRSDSEIVLKVVEQFTDEYIQVSIEPAMEIEKPIIEEVYEVGRICKTEVLQRLLDFCDLQSSVLFVNSTVSAQSVRRVLDLKGCRTSCLTYTSTSAEKNDAMDYFNAGDIDFLIVTDLGAVGLDLEGVQQVIQYELSDEVDDFGDRVLLCEKNILLVAPEEISQLDIIEEAIGRSLKRFQVPFIEGLGTNDENRLFEAVSTRLVRNDFRRREAIIQRLLQVAPSTIDAMGAIMDYALEVQAKTRSGDDESRGPRKPSRPVQNDSASVGGQRDNRPRKQAPPVKKPRPQGGQAMTQISLNVGYRDQIKPNHVVGAILGETGLSAECVGMIEIFDNNVLVEIAKEHSDFVLDRLNQTNINGIRIKAELAHAGHMSGGKNFKDRGRDRDRGGSNRRGGGGYRKGGNPQFEKRGGNDGNYFD